jgi:hypothetical protein
MPDGVNLTLLSIGYFCIPINLLLGMPSNYLETFCLFGSCFYDLLGSFRTVLRLEIIIPNAQERPF